MEEQNHGFISHAAIVAPIPAFPRKTREGARSLEVATPYFAVAAAFAASSTFTAAANGLTPIASKISLG